MYSHLRKNLLALIEAFRTPFSIPFDSNPYFSKSAQKPTQRYLPAPTTIPPDDPSPKKTPDQRTAAAGMASRRYFEDWGFPSTASSSASSLVSMDVSHGKPAFSLSLRLRPAPGANVLFRVAKFSRFNQPTTIHSSLLGGRVFQLPKPKRARATNTWASNFSRGRKWKCFLCVICIIGRSDAAIWEGDVIVSYRQKINQTHRYCCCAVIRIEVPSLLFEVFFLWNLCICLVSDYQVQISDCDKVSPVKSRKGWKGNRKVPICGKHLTGYTEISFRRAICVVVREVGLFHINTEQKEAL